MGSGRTATDGQPRRHGNALGLIQGALHTSPQSMGRQSSRSPDQRSTTQIRLSSVSKPVTLPPPEFFDPHHSDAALGSLAMDRLHQKDPNVALFRLAAPHLRHLALEGRPCCSRKEIEPWPILPACKRAELCRRRPCKTNPGRTKPIRTNPIGKTNPIGRTNRCGENAMISVAPDPGRRRSPRRGRACKTKPTKKGQ